MNVIIVKGNILNANSDVIVNAANSALLRGGGVCGAIFNSVKEPHKLENDLKKIGYCKTGDAVITKSYGLNQPYIIHAVGPIYTSDEDQNFLSSAYLKSLELADKYGLKTIAFPSISTGIYGYPLEKASIIALKTILEYEAKNLNTCYLYCYDNNTYISFMKSYDLLKIK